LPEILMPFACFKTTDFTDEGPNGASPLMNLNCGTEPPRKSQPGTPSPPGISIDAPTGSEFEKSSTTIPWVAGLSGPGCVGTGIVGIFDWKVSFCAPDADRLMLSFFALIGMSVNGDVTGASVQSGRQPSPTIALPSSHSSPAVGIPFPHAVSVQLAS